jgi:threonine dehydrogenase-like Zn-dependent dehydrogenase
MRALTYHGPRRVRVDSKPDPRIEHPSDIILKVERTAICGSDLHLWNGLVADTRVGQVFGHEFAGTVDQVGPEVRTLRRGDRVVVPFNIACGVCFFCARGLTASCEQSNPNSDVFGGAFGYSHLTGGYDGGQAEYVRVPFADVGPLKLDGLDWEKGLFLGDILPTGYQAAEMAGVEPGDVVMVFGCGPVGLFAARCAQLMGAGRVICVDRVEERLELARTWLGAEIVDLESVDDIVLHARRMTGGRGPDAVIDAVGLEAEGSRLHTFLGRKLRLEAGAPTVLEWAIHCVRHGGRISIVGVYGPPANLVPIGVAMNKGLTLRMGQCNVRRYMPRLLELIKAGEIDPTAIITHRLPLDDAPEAYAMFAAKRDGCIKVVLDPAA